MTEEIFYIIQIVSTFSVVPAILVGSLLLKRVSLSIQLFTALLILGFLTDLSGWYFYLTKNGSANQNVRYVYILAECLFYFWFLGTQIAEKKISTLCKYVGILSFPVLIFAIQYQEGIRYFMTVFQIVVSVIISYCILKCIEKEEDVLRQLVFWVLIGSFFYYFCTFFFMSFLNSQLGVKFWYLKNVIGITSNIIYTWGFILHRRSILSSV